MYGKLVAFDPLRMERDTRAIVAAALCLVALVAPIAQRGLFP